MIPRVGVKKQLVVLPVQQTLIRPKLHHRVYRDYGCDRFETSAEIVKMRRDGCSIIGMTGMPEASLARELNMDYASIALVVNWCAGIEDSVLNMTEIEETLELGIKTVVRLIRATLAQASQ